MPPSGDQFGANVRLAIALDETVGDADLADLVQAFALGKPAPDLAAQDPAQSSSIILTTVTDVVGFFSFLGLATLFSALLPT